MGKGKVSILLLITAILIIGCADKDAKRKTSSDITEESIQEAVDVNEKSIDDKTYEPFTQEEIDSMQYVNDSILELVESEEFKNASKQDRLDMAIKLTKQLERENYITRIFYDAEDLVSFQYSCGIDGGISLKVNSDYYIYDKDGKIIDAIN